MQKKKRKITLSLGHRKAFDSVNFHALLINGDFSNVRRRRQQPRRRPRHLRAQGALPRRLRPGMDVLPRRAGRHAGRGGAADIRPPERARDAAGVAHVYRFV